MTIQNRLLLAASAAFCLAVPSLSFAQADSAAQAPADAASQPQAAQADPAASTSQSEPTGGKDYPRCSKTVTDNCIQGQGSSHGKARHHKGSHHRAKPKS